MDSLSLRRRSGERGVASRKRWINLATVDDRSIPSYHTAVHRIVPRPAGNNLTNLSRELNLKITRAQRAKEIARLVGWEKD